MAYEFFKARNDDPAVDMTPWLKQANEVLGSMGKLYAAEFGALADLMGKTSFMPLAPYDANGAKTTEIW